MPRLINSTVRGAICLALFASFVILGPLSHAAGDESKVLAQLERSRASYTTPETWQKRSAEIAQGLLAGGMLWPPIEKTPLNPIVHSRREYADYTVENVALETFPGFYCMGNLYRPKSLAKPGPAILCPHGHFAPLGRFREEHQIRCAQLARMGATVFSYGMVGWQDSSQTTHDDPLVFALQTHNSIRALDYVASLENVDPTRIGITGASGGGTQSLILAAIDPRIAACAPVVIVYPWSAPQDCCLCEGAGLPIMQLTGTNCIEVAASIAPRPLLVISAGKDDPTVRFPEVGAPFVSAAYNILGKPEAFRNVYLADEGHDYGPSKRKAAYEFFVETFGLSPLAEDLGAIKIEPPEALAAVDAAHPLPATALAGTAAVNRAFHNLGRLASDDTYLFTAPGFAHQGVPARAEGEKIGHVKVTVRLEATNQPTPCRINIVGPDGNFYQPPENDLTPYALTGVWPDTGRGNRPEKAPYRYYGRYFYSRGQSTVDVPAGTVRIEVWKGFEIRPQSVTTTVAPGETAEVELTLEPNVAMSEIAYYCGDPHLHFDRKTTADEDLILDLLEAEDLRFGSILAYNEPAGPYPGVMDRMATPQMRGLGARSVRERGEYSIISGQEYRSGTYGHLNVYLRDGLLLDGVAGDATYWPLYGDLVADTHRQGGIAHYAHGGYSQAIYADFVQGNIDGVELLQFGVYRGIGLEDWYHILNIGYRLPCNGASDYPACRALSDCRTYVQFPGRVDFPSWLTNMAAGRSFVTTGPMLLVEVDGEGPGGTLQKSGAGPHRVNAKVRVFSEVAPVTNVQLIVGGRVVDEMVVPSRAGRGSWLELKRTIDIPTSTWVAARAFSTSPFGSPDAEAHTNPVFVSVDGKPPYSEASLDAIVARLDGQIAAWRERDFPEKSQVLDYFQRSRDILLDVRAKGGLPAGGPAAAASAASGAQPKIDLGRRHHTEAELKEFLKPLPPSSPEEALTTFETADGFHMELVAAEPLVVDPIAAAFDENGNLYVAEMRDYPFFPREGEKPLGTVRLLRDTDDDGRYDESHVFADGLLWAAGIAPSKGGVYVASSPDIWYLKDTDGDHRADVRQRVFTGFGTQNQQGMLNNLIWGLDHWIYGSTSSNGGQIRIGDSPQSAPIRVSGSDFRFRAGSHQFETTTGTRQFGHTFDDWGNRFLCSESQPLVHAVLPQHYLARNPFLPVHSALNDVGGHPVPIFRLSPVERWRMIRSSRRIAHGERDASSAGASHHVIDAAAGLVVYRGAAYPADCYGQVFVSDAQNNLIHRRTLAADGPTFKSERVDDDNAEFVRSSDNWFRPVNLVNAPDGTLYVLDMSREIIESVHIPLDVMKHLDLTLGRDQGRIYRIAPDGFRYPKGPKLGTATGAELVAALESPHGWWRDTAHRLIYERQDKSLVPALQKLAASGSSPQSRVHGLWSLSGLEALTSNDVDAALRDAAPQVRRHAVELAERFFAHHPQVVDQVARLANDADPAVRFQVAFSLGESNLPAAEKAWLQLASRADLDSWTRTALLSSAAPMAERLIVALLSNSELAALPERDQTLNSFAEIVGARNNPRAVSNTLFALAEYQRAQGNSAAATAVCRNAVRHLALGTRRAGAVLALHSPPKSEDEVLVREMFDEAAKTSASADASEAERVSAIELVGCFPLRATQELLSARLDPREPAGVQRAAVAALAGYSEARVAELILARWSELGPEARAVALDALLARKSWTVALLAAVHSGIVPGSQLSLAQRESLLRNHDADIAAAAQAELGNPVFSLRESVVADYEPVLAMSADTARGQQLFEKHCQTCHRLGSKGNRIGPDLTATVTSQPAAVMVNILDPNRNVLPRYEQYAVIDTSGRTFAGIIADETATSITLVRGEGVQDVVLRSQIDELSSVGRSLMPEGLEREISKQDMADLLAYLGAAQDSASTSDDDGRPLDIGTEPGLIEPPASSSGR